MSNEHPRKDQTATHKGAARQNVEKPRGDEDPPFTGPSTDPLATWGTGGSEDDRSGQRSNPRPARRAPATATPTNTPKADEPES